MKGFKPRRSKFKMPKGHLTMKQALSPKGINYKGKKRASFKF